MKRKKIKAYKISVYKEPTVKRCLLILDLNPFRSQVKGKHSIGKEFQSLAVRGMKLLTVSREAASEGPAVLHIRFCSLSNNSKLQLGTPAQS